MSVFLTGLKISGYRSFVSEVKLTGLSKINILIGQNNSGKSNVLRFLARHLPHASQQGASKLDLIHDKPKKAADVKTTCAIQVLPSSFLYNNVFGDVPLEGKNIIEFTLLGMQDGYWCPYEYGGSKFDFNQNALARSLEVSGLSPNHWHQVFRSLFGNSGAGNLVAWLVEISRRFDITNSLPKNVALIPASRSIRQYQTAGLTIDGKGLHNIDGILDHSGIGLVGELFKLQNPELGKDSDKLRFNKINQLIRDITENSSVALEIPYSSSDIYVNMDGKRLSLSSLGSGVEQVLIIAAKSTLFSKQIVCIEEPEVHLHPTLQRKLINYLYEETDNQYFIATHSPNFMDTVPASVYHIKLKDAYSEIVGSISDTDRFAACSDLGYKASDLLQSNFIVWVEGPSDRVYLVHWIKKIDPNLREGLHYSIMFYGGRLLNHLTGSDEALGEFIMLPKLNRNMAILIDSDKTKARDPINATKERIKAEFESNGQVVWVTAGREIENYIPASLYAEAVKACHPSALNMPSHGRYENLTEFYTTRQKTKTGHRTIDKLKVAHYVVKRSEQDNLDWKVQDWYAKIKVLVSAIQKANIRS